MRSMPQSTISDSRTLIPQSNESLHFIPDRPVEDEIEPGLFGAFDSYNAAVDAAKANDLYSHNSEVVIDEVELKQFGEV